MLGNDHSRTLCNSRIFNMIVAGVGRFHVQAPSVLHGFAGQVARRCQNLHKKL